VRTAEDAGPRPVSGPFSPTPSSGSSPATATVAAPSGPSAPSAPAPDRIRRPSQGPRTATSTPTSDDARPARPTTSTSTTSAAAAASGPRRVRLAVARIDPWSVMKLAFLLSVAVGIMIVVSAAVVWYTLDKLAVFTKINGVIATLSGSTDFFDITQFASFERVISLATMIGVVDIILLTALSTIGAFLYNIVAALVGGIHLTLTDD
jgi:hypothetical protein